MPQAMGIYIHIPFCLARCNYCAFVSLAGAEEMHAPYVAALCSEIAAAGGDFSLPAAKVDTVFLGGGTPTVLAASALGEILQKVRTTFVLDADAEISIEANPGTLDPVKLSLLRFAGFNRLSIGVQSFDDAVLNAAARIHRAAQAKETFSQAREAGFDNISLDLMYGLPGQSGASWQDTLKQAIALGPEHISAYGLKLEEGTPLSKAVESGRVALPVEEAEEAMYDELNVLLPQKGYLRYEISNYALPGQECRHNMKYWRWRSYRGFGVAAHSFCDAERFANVEGVQEYLKRIHAGHSPENFRETADPTTAMAEYAFLALRMAAGLNGAEFARIFDRDFDAVFGVQIGRLERKGLLVCENKTVRLTALGMKLGNQVFVEFLP